MKEEFNMTNAFDIVVNEEHLEQKKVFVAHCLNLGITSQGKTFEEAMENIKDAIKLYLEENPQEVPENEDLMPPMATRLFL